MEYDFEFKSRRSCVLATRGMVAASQPLAAQVGLDVLKRGGNAADAAIATAAMMVVVEPISNGIGGDCFALYFDAGTKQISALNGSGRSGAAANAAALRKQGYSDMPLYTGAAVTVPGCVRGWSDMLEKHGTLKLAELLQPAIETAERGFPVTEWIGHAWRLSEKKLLRAPDWRSGDKDNGPEQPSGNELLLNGRAPQAGEVIKLSTLATTLRGIAADGPAHIYEGEFAKQAAEHVQKYGGWLTADDFAAHEGEWVDALSTDYHGAKLYECPPNGQGLAALVACNIANAANLAKYEQADRLAHMIEFMRVGFEVAGKEVYDPKWAKVDKKHLCERAYGISRLVDIDASQAFKGHVFGRTGNDTIYLSVVDGEGNACSWIQSCYMGTGTGLVVPGTGVSLQNRGAGFSLDKDHPNLLEPRKRPYHTIIPAMSTRDGELHACFGIMGGHMQPQAHFQVLTHLLDGKNPQQALDEPRWQLVGHGGKLLMEPGFDEEVIADLERRGYEIRIVDGFESIHMGGGQVIQRNPASGVLIAGSDPRKDGCAVGF
ncbi:MAG: gamma-glutamyltransferase family protein [Planctomycetes bacterium]|nr:gamma-glutamyltransferase family protein [Planctomycetota bacterium]